MLCDVTSLLTGNDNSLILTEIMEKDNKLLSLKETAIERIMPIVALPCNALLLTYCNIRSTIYIIEKDQSIQCCAENYMGFNILRHELE